MGVLPIKVSLPKSFFKEETLCDYRVTKETKQLWAVLLDLLVEFDRVCKEHDIKYVLDGGTFLGAVRHQGFIPWDDDIDVAMLREEYQRLCSVAPIAFRPPYFWQTNETDPGSLRRHAQLRNSMTTCILKYETNDGKPKYGFNQGAFLDVFVMDAVPDSPDELQVYRNNQRTYIGLLSNMKDWYWLFQEESWAKSMQQEADKAYRQWLVRHNEKGYKRVALSYTYNSKISVPLARSLFEDCADYAFCGLSFPGPRDYDRVLTDCYGDWHQFVKDGSDHGNIIVDLNKPYTEYIHDRGKIMPPPERRDRKIRQLRRRLKRFYMLTCLLGLLAVALAAFLIV